LLPRDSRANATASPNKYSSELITGLLAANANQFDNEACPYGWYRRHPGVRNNAITESRGSLSAIRSVLAQATIVSCTTNAVHLDILNSVLASNLLASALKAASNSTPFCPVAVVMATCSSMPLSTPAEVHSFRTFAGCFS
jgi:hypothetical protein